jgi:hypothetical protein
MRAAALAQAVKDFTTEQVGKARELIADGGIVRTRPSDGVTLYSAHFAGCSCPAGIHGRRCYHVAAVRIIGATGRA